MLFSFLCCVVGFKRGCTPLFFLNGTQLLEKYKSNLFGVIGKDGNAWFFHMDANWTWSLSTLRDVSYGDDDYEKIITFVSD